MDDKQRQIINGLTDTDSILVEISGRFIERYFEYKGRLEAIEHGESPTLKALSEQYSNGGNDEIANLINEHPLEFVNCLFQAVADYIAENNRHVFGLAGFDVPSDEDY